MNKNVKYGWYSKKQAKIRSENINNYSHMDKSYVKNPASLYWSNRNGEPIEITMVSNTMDHKCNTKYLDDLIYVGEVYKYIGPAKYNLD